MTTEKHIEEEIKRLRDELAEDPRYKRLSILEQTLDMLRGVYTQPKSELNGSMDEIEEVVAVEVGKYREMKERGDTWPDVVLALLRDNRAAGIIDNDTPDITDQLVKDGVGPNRDKVGRNVSKALGSLKGKGQAVGTSVKGERYLSWRLTE